MTEPTVAKVRDKNGRVHFAARESLFVRDGLVTGELIDVEAPRETPADAPADDSADTKPARRGPRDRAGDKTSTDDH